VAAVAAGRTVTRQAGNPTAGRASGVRSRRETAGKSRREPSRHPGSRGIRCERAGGGGAARRSVRGRQQAGAHKVGRGGRQRKAAAERRSRWREPTCAGGGSRCAQAGICATRVNRAQCRRRRAEL